MKTIFSDAFIEISLKFDSKGPIDINQEMVQIMAWGRLGTGGDELMLIPHIISILCMW